MTIFRLALRRLAWSIPLAFVASLVAFVLIALLPGDAARALVGRNATDAQLEEVRAELGLHEPLWLQYSRWLQSAVQGDLGDSMLSRQPVTSLLNGRLEPSLSLIVGATLVALAVGVALGIRGARHGPVGRVVDAGSIVGLAVPDFWLGLVLIVVFAVQLRLLPPTGYAPVADGLGAWLRSIALPVCTLAVPATAIIAKQTRDAMSTALARPYVRTLRAAGISERAIVFRHALRNAAIPVLTVVGLIFIGALGGTVAVESVFAIPGLGSTAVSATANRDLPLIQGVVVYFTLIVIAINLLVDLAYGYFDPRIRVR